MNVVRHDLDLDFQGQTFQMAILTSKGGKMQTLPLQSDRNSDICYRMAPLRMLYITTVTKHFQGHEFKMRIS